MRVVIAEDQFLLREGMASLLKEHGFDVAEAVGDGPSLLRALTSQRPPVRASRRVTPSLAVVRPEAVTVTRVA